MKRLTLLFVASFIFAISFAQTTAALDSLVSAYTRVHKFNGSVLVARQGTLLLNKGYGYRNLATKEANTAETIYQLGSITKQFTAAVILKLEAEKKLKLTDKLSKYFPDFPKGDSITIQHLLTHTSGIYNYTNDEEFMANEVTKPATPEKMIALFRDKPLDFSPGTGWNYSNSGYSLLGYIIEAVTKQPYEKVLRHSIFEPLQMSHSGFDFTHLAKKEKATGYFVINANDAQEAFIVDSSVSFSAGSIYSSTGDLYRWHQALESNSILTAEQQERAYTPVKNSYGYGWVIDSVDGKRAVSHSGGIPGFVTNIKRIPADDICIVLLSNASDTTLDEITQNLIAILYGKDYELPVERKRVTLSLDKLEEYVGEYVIKPGLNVVMEIKDSKLLVTPTGQHTEEMLAEKEDLFFVQSADISVAFTRDGDHKIDGFILHQNGQKITCKKLK